MWNVTMFGDLTDL